MVTQNYLEHKTTLFQNYLVSLCDCPVAGPTGGGLTAALGLVRAAGATHVTGTGLRSGRRAGAAVGTARGGGRRRVMRTCRVDTTSAYLIYYKKKTCRHFNSYIQEICFTAIMNLNMLVIEMDTMKSALQILLSVAWSLMLLSSRHLYGSYKLM